VWRIFADDLEAPCRFRRERMSRTFVTHARDRHPRRLRSAAAALVTVLLGGGYAAGAEPRVVTLAEASRAALAFHEEIRAAEAGERQATVIALRAYTVLGPSVTQRGSYTREKDEIAFPTTPSQEGTFNPVILQGEALRGTLSVEQPLYRHEFWALRDLGRSEQQRSFEVTRRARQEVLRAVAESYYRALRTRAIADVAEETRRLAETEVSHADARVDAGEAVRSETVRARTELARAKERIVTALGERQVAMERIARLTGIPAPFEVADPPPRRLTFSSVEPLVALAARQNPDLKAAEASLASAREEEKRRWAELLPTLGVRFDYRLVDHQAFAERNDFWDLVAEVEIPLVEGGGRRYLDVQEQRAKVAEAEARLTGARRDLELLVREAFVSVRTLEARLTAADEEVRLAADTYRLLSDQYAAGVVTNLDVLQALTARDQARVNLEAVRYEREIALVDLDRATGLLEDALAAPRSSP
jgi:outer membrane protein